MTLTEELSHGLGYRVVKADAADVLDTIRDQFLEGVRTFSGLADIRDIDHLRETVTGLPEGETNKLTMHLLSSCELSSDLVSAFAGSVEEIAGDDLFLQRRPHIMFNTSDATHTRAMPHFDAMAGISPYTITLWAPIHDISDDSGIWVKDQHSSIQHMNSELDRKHIMGDDVLGLQDNVPLKIKFGYGVLFNPFVLHGAYPHDNPLTRIGISTRFQRRAKPLFVRNSEFFTPYQLSCP